MPAASYSKTVEAVSVLVPVFVVTADESRCGPFASSPLGYSYFVVRPVVSAPNFFWTNSVRFANTGRAVVDAGKFDYLFGTVASNAHNAARSAQNAQQLARIGVYDNAAGRSLLSSHFDDVVVGSNNVARTFTNEYGTFQVRDSLFAGPGGFLKFESTWQVTDDGLRLTTVIPMGGS